MSSLNLDPKDTRKKYWKSLDELGEAPEFQDFLHREFPEGASEMGSGVSRRKFLQVTRTFLAPKPLARIRWRSFRIRRLCKSFR